MEENFRRERFMRDILFRIILSERLRFISHFFCIVVVLFPLVLIVGRIVYGSYPSHREISSSFLPGKSLPEDNGCWNSEKNFHREDRPQIAEYEGQMGDNRNRLPFVQFQTRRIRDGLYSQITQPGVYDAQTPVAVLSSTTSAPEVTTGPASNVTHNSAALQGTVNAHGLSTTAWLQYRIVNGPSRNTFATQTVIGASDTEVSFRIIELLPGTTYYYRLAARNDAGTSYGNEMSFTTTDMHTPTTTEITPPVGAIRINGNDDCTNSLTVTANLSATDNTGVTGYYLSSSTVPPSRYSAGWTSITPTSNYKEDVAYTFSNGDGRNVVYVWYKDASGNISDVVSASIVVDTTPPAITILNPTSDQTFTTTNGTISVSGRASDDMNEVSSVVWVSDREISKTERKIIGWTIPDIDLRKGDNVITVKATDRVGNTGMATITITYAEANNPPVVITGPATALTVDLATLTGTVHARGLPTMAWFQYGTSSEHYTGSSSIQNIENIFVDVPISNRVSGLQAGTTYYFRLAAQNSAGTTYGNEITLNTLPPKGNITGNVVHFVKGEPVESVRLRLKGAKARKKSFRTAFSRENGFFEFKDLDADTYELSVMKTDYMSASQTVKIVEGEEKKIVISLRKTREEDKDPSKEVKNDQVVKPN